MINGRRYFTSLSKISTSLTHRPQLRNILAVFQYSQSGWQLQEVRFDGIKLPERNTPFSKTTCLACSVLLKQRNTQSGIVRIRKNKAVDKCKPKSGCWRQVNKLVNFRTDGGN